MKQHPSHKHVFSCTEVYAHLCDNLDEQLDSESCRQIKAHIAECKNCTALLDSLKKTVYLYRKCPVPKLPSRLKSEVFAVINVSQQKKKKISHR